MPPRAKSLPPGQGSQGIARDSHDRSRIAGVHPNINTHVRAFIHPSLHRLLADEDSCRLPVLCPDLVIQGIDLLYPYSKRYRYSHEPDFPTHIDDPNKKAPGADVEPPRGEISRDSSEKLNGV